MIAAVLLLLSACSSLPSWLGGPKPSKTTAAPSPTASVGFLGPQPTETTPDVAVTESPTFDTLQPLGTGSNGDELEWPYQLRAGDCMPIATTEDAYPGDDTDRAVEVTDCGAADAAYSVTHVEAWTDTDSSSYGVDPQDATRDNDGNTPLDEAARIDICPKHWPVHGVHGILAPNPDHFDASTGRNVVVCFTTSKPDSDLLTIAEY